jgi:hypothetical protein
MARGERGGWREGRGGDGERGEGGMAREKSERGKAAFPNKLQDMSGGWELGQGIKEREGERESEREMVKQQNMKM